MIKFLAIILGCIAALLGGWMLLSRAPTASNTTDRYPQDFSKAEKAIQEFYQPKGPLVWGPVETTTEMTDVHPLGVPMSKKTGVSRTRWAKVGDLTYRVVIHYTNVNLIQITVGGERVDTEKPLAAAKRLGLHPDLVAEFAKTENDSVRFREHTFAHTLENATSTMRKNANGDWVSADGDPALTAFTTTLIP